jgi:hypothetical protein
MRSLILLLASSLIVSDAYSFYQTAGLNYKTGQNVSYYRDTETSIANTSTTTVNYGAFEILGHHNVTVTYDQVDVPYESLVVKRQNPETGAAELTPLSELYTDKFEHWLTLGYEFAMGDWTLSTQGRSAVNDVAYKSDSLNASVRYQAGELTTLLAGVEYQRTKRPESYTENTLGTFALPTKIYMRRFSLGVEQIITGKMKAGLGVETSRSAGERPRNYGFNGSLAYALSGSLFAKAGFVSREEIDSRVIDTVGGHLNYKSGYAELTWEPAYDLFVSASYQLAVEKQAEVEIGKETQIAFDEYGLGLSYQWDSALKTTGKASYVDSNIFKEQINLEAGVEWTF